MISMDLRTGSLGNKETEQGAAAWNVLHVEQDMIAQKVKARAYFVFRFLPLVKGVRTDMGPPWGDEKSKNNILFCEDNEKEQLCDSQMIKMMFVWQN